MQDIALDGRVLAFTAAISALTGVLFGIVPGTAVVAHRSRSRYSRKVDAIRASAPVGFAACWSSSEIAASVVLVAAAMLLARSFARLLDVDAGFNPAHVLTLRTSLPTRPTPIRAAMVRAYAEVGRAAARVAWRPGRGRGRPACRWPARAAIGASGSKAGRSIRAKGSPPTGRWSTPGYFEALGTPLRGGRTFTDADTAASLPVIVVNETMAKKYWPGVDPIGRRMTMGSNDRWITVVGVVADIHHRGLDMEPRPEMYRPHTQFRYGGADAPAVQMMTWAVRTTDDPRAAVSYARAAVSAVDARLGISDVATMDAVVADSTSDRRLNMLLFVLLGTLALALATVGVYGVVAYSVSQRTHEIGVRMAIGARPNDVVRLMLGEGGRLAVAGVVSGSLIALAAARLIRGLLFEVSATDPLTFVAVAGGLLAVALLASYIPARRATRVDPMIALRGE